MDNKKTVITGGNLIDGIGGDPLRNAVLYIEDEKIVAIGEKGELDIPKNAKVIDVSGKTIIPGLIDAHLHYSGSRISDGPMGRLKIGEACKAIRAAVDAH